MLHQLTGGPNISQGVQIFQCPPEIFVPGGTILGGSKFFVTGQNGQQDTSNIAPVTFKNQTVFVCSAYEHTNIFPFALRVELMDI